MARFATIVEAVLRNAEGCELNRVELMPDTHGYYSVSNVHEQGDLGALSVGDTLTIEERETEIE